MNFLANPIIYEIVKQGRGSRQGGEGKGKVVIFMLSSITERGISG